MIYQLINWYTKRFSFPHRGLKYFLSFLKATALIQKKFTKRLHNGLLINVSPAEHIQKYIFWYGYYEKKHVLCWEYFIEDESIAIDIGANIGYYSLVASAENPAGKIYSFEPYSLKFEELNANIRLNKLQNIIPVHAAVSDHGGKARIYISGKDNEGESGLLSPENYEGIMEEVKVVTLDEWSERNHIEKIGFIKMDIEGAEYLALEGMKQILLKWKPVVFIEIEPVLLAKYGKRGEDIFDFMEQLGFEGHEVISPNEIRRVTSNFKDDLVVFLPENYQLNARIRKV
jgi:FkbM family methyltransferase